MMVKSKSYYKNCCLSKSQEVMIIVVVVFSHMGTDLIRLSYTYKVLPRASADSVREKIYAYFKVKCIHLKDYPYYSSLSLSTYLLHNAEMQS